MYNVYYIVHCIMIIIEYCSMDTDYIIYLRLFWYLNKNNTNNIRRLYLQVMNLDNINYLRYIHIHIYIYSEYIRRFHTMHTCLLL